MLELNKDKIEQKNKEAIIFTLIWLIVTWTSNLQPPKNFRVTAKEDYEN